MQGSWKRAARRRASALALLIWAALSAAGAAPAAEDAGAPAPEPASRFFDPEDGWFDVSGFLDTAYGFVPLVAPITEPAVGYGAAGALVFIDRNVPAEGQRHARPNIAIAGGLSTENGTRGVFAGHLGTWMGGRLQTLVGVADADINLDFFGLGGDRRPGGTGLPYAVAARGGAAGASYRAGETPLWLGLRYGLANTRVTPRGADPSLLGIPQSERELRLAGLTPSITLDTRDNFFTPTDGWYADLSVTLFREALGSDRDFDKADLTVMYYRSLSRSLFLGARGSVKTSSSGTPFYLRPFVMLRGVQALQYQGEEAAEAEAELRWQLHPRFSLVGFGGVGVARAGAAGRDTEKAVTSGGAGFRYLVARTYGLHMGMDVGFGPDEAILYVVFGSAWVRP
ncbi:MAG TPA: BamA/TamA family outer membrane protein [Burkholderiales bacterium]|nr:BamA/TamA family outer membrane protein [Burkholderiales bacterium]